MNLDLLFHDSEVQGLTEAAGQLVIRFSAAHVRRGGPSVPPASVPEHGYARSLVMILQGAQPCGPLQDCFGRLTDGRLCLGGQRLSRLPLPFAAEGPLRCELEFKNGAILTVAASSVACAFESDPGFIESYAC